MENPILTKKNYSIFDRSYMAFGSIMNSCQHIITEKNKQEIIDWAWKNAVLKTKKLLDTLYFTNGQIPEPTDEERKQDAIWESALERDNEIQDEEDAKKQNQKGK